MNNSLRTTIFKLRHPLKQAFNCPICHYKGPFRDLSPSTGLRRHAKCPQCGALERHRLQHLVLQRVMEGLDPKAMRVLHFAPEPFFRQRFHSMFGRYETADLEMPGVDHYVDLQSLPMESNSFDLVYASHVLEHVSDDGAAISEIRRILSPSGIAILPVPIVAASTREYERPNPLESMHVRAPGPDYFDRYRRHFSRVQVHSSDEFTARHQPHLFSQTRDEAPGASRSRICRRSDFVPVCYV